MYIGITENFLLRDAILINQIHLQNINFCEILMEELGNVYKLF